MERKIKLLNLLERWKGLQEETLLQKLSKTQSELKALTSQKKELEKELSEFIKQIETKKIISAEELISKIYAKEQVKTLIQQYQEKEGQKKKEIQKIRENLEAVHKEKKLYETLKNRLYALYQMEKYRAFLRELDELTIIKKARESK